MCRTVSRLSPQAHSFHSFLYVLPVSGDSTRTSCLAVCKQHIDEVRGPCETDSTSETHSGDKRRSFGYKRGVSKPAVPARRCAVYFELRGAGPHVHAAHAGWGQPRRCVAAVLRRPRAAAAVSQHADRLDTTGQRAGSTALQDRRPERPRATGRRKGEGVTPCAFEQSVQMRWTSSSGMC